MKKTILSRIALAAAALAAVVSYAGEVKPINVPAGELTEALEVLAKQSGAELVYQTDQVKAFRTQGVNGSLSAEEALERLLKGTPLAVKTDPTGAILIAVPKAQEIAQAEVSSSFKGEGQSEDQKGSSSSSGSSEAEKSKISEIIVTAQKRQERLQNVPISITALGGADLDRASFQGVTEALGTVPGVSTLVDGQSSGTRLAVRGVTATDNLFNGSSPIAYYLDGVPFGLVRSALAPDSSAYDLARIEVLRGPQGTLYGASALNGVVRVLTHDADLHRSEFKMRAADSRTSHGGNNYRGDAVVNIPLIEGKLGVRAGVGYQEWSGWINSRTAVDANSENKVNPARLRNYRLNLNAQPTDDLAVGLSFWRSNNDHGAPSLADDEGHNHAGRPQASAIIYDVYNLRAVYNLPGFSVSSMTGYLDYEGDTRLDGTPFGPDFALTTGLDSRVFSQEVLLSSESTNVWRWNVGAMYRDGKDLNFQKGVDGGGIFAGSGVVLNNFTDTSESSAVYGELSRRFADGKLEWTLGARYFHDQIETEAHSPVALGQDAFTDVPVSDSFDSTTPRAVLTWLPTANWTAYASFSQGFRSGLPQFPSVAISNPDIPFAKPDKLSNYEMGSKGSLFNRRVTFDAALFYIDWQNVQQTLGIDDGRGITPALVNGESASGVGFDLGLKAKLLERLSAGVTFGWNDLTFDAPVLSGGLLLFDKGERLNGSPEYTLGASFDYAVPLGGSGFDGRWSASANYTSKRNSTLLDGTTRLLGKGDSLLFARTSLSVDSPQNWTVALYVDNLSDERGSSLVVPTFPFANQRMRPRTMGVQFEYRWQ